ncbi:HotDog domain-containing protein [Aspergillus granulosus]|uniref:HotDog domain-containing protein n=1 Tax=Aspergillus granulosus TaxID=176169 RepID=A0ABR4H7U0_9EURO
MSSLPRSLSRLLRKQSPTTLHITRTAIRTAQTHATASTLKPSHPPPPPSPHHSFQHAHTNPAQTQQPTEDPISTHPLLQSLRADPTLKETRPHLSMAPSLRPAHFVAGALAGANKLTSAPYMFLSRRSASASHNTGTTTNSSTTHKSRAITLFHTGTQMCGHPGFVHGGFLSVMFDEVFAHTVSQSFRSGTGMTANLNVDFRKPAIPGRVYVLRAEVVKVEGRKAWVEGSMTMLGEGEKREDVVVAEARALFVEPKFAESMVPVYRN